MPLRSPPLAARLAVLVTLALAGVPRGARAQNNVRPRVLLMVDTSGSMNWHFGDNDTSGGDGSTSYTDGVLARDVVNHSGLTPLQGFQIQAGAPACPAQQNARFDGVNSRLFAAKAAVRNVLDGAGSIEWGLMRYTGSYCAFSGVFNITGGNCATDWDCRLSNGWPEFCVGGRCGRNANLCVLDANLGLTDRRTGNCADTARMVSTFGGTCGSAAGGGTAACAAPQVCYADADCSGAANGQCALLAGSGARSCQCGGGFAGCPTGYACTGGRCLYSTACQNPGGVVVIDPRTPGANAAIAPWVDGIEDFRDAGGGLARNPELRGVGPTPLAGAARAATAWYAGIRSGNLDAQITCRPYVLVQLTDGADTCDTDVNRGPVAAVRGFVAATVANARQLNKVYVVGLAFQVGDPAVSVLNEMARAGGTSSARFANNQQDIQAALADIVASSVLVERCNNADDDCNTQCDEPFPDVAVTGLACTNKHAAKACDNGQLGGTHCFATGSYACSLDQLSELCNAPTCQTDARLCPVVESCNNADDDCNGVIDDCTPFVAGSCCQNRCPACNLAGSPLPETCNGCDDDCDGTIDNHLTDTGKGCGLALGLCEPGLTYCCQELNPTVGGCTQSQVQPQNNNPNRLACLGGRAPQDESCNGVDDNCNGVVDEISQACFPFVGGAPGVGICRAGLQTCNAPACGAAPHGCCPNLSPPIAPGKPCPGNARFGACGGAVGPRAELCNGLDDDCNGVVDDNITDPWAGMACCATGNLADCQNSGLGTRCKAGVYGCSGGARVCGGGVAKATETCNGADDDCNGAVDDVAGLGGACEGNGVKTAGACRGGWVCAGMAGPGPNLLTCAQAVGPMPEVCNGLDDDCDGVVDDEPADVGMPCGAPCPGGLLGNCLGACKAGTIACNGGRPVCAGGVRAVLETCNGVDDDCNGAVDDVAGAGTPCVGGGVDTDGICTASWACAGGQAGPGPNGLTCTQARGPGIEKCNGIDDDCNGVADNDPIDVGAACGDPCPGGQVNRCVGECKAGKTVCQNGAAACAGASGPSPEACDGADNDCNGQVDDQLKDPWLGTGCCPSGNLADCANAGGGQTCKPGLFACVAGARLCSGGVARTPEVCNAIDDDCNGIVDDVPGIGRPCAGGGVLVTGRCTAQLMCDGRKGDGPAGLTCRQVDGPEPELCNGIDDDCDGVVDNDLKDPRVGVPGGKPCLPLPVGQDLPPCSPGITVCAAGMVLCKGQVLPVPNVCDQPPTDCTGNPNPIGECPDGSSCQNGMCVKPCEMSEFPCPGGFLCDPQTRNCIPDACVQRACPPGTFCRIDGQGNAQCIDRCDSVTCPVATRCLEGLCVDDSCRTRGCPENELCLGTPPACRPNPCAAVRCAAGQFCRDGQCIAPCRPACAAGEVCIDGRCQDDPCYRKECSAGMVCNIIDGRGVCIPAQCAAGDGACNPGTSCCEGVCRTDTCAGFVCPEATACAYDRLCNPICEEGALLHRAVGAGGGGFVIGCRVDRRRGGRGGDDVRVAAASLLVVLLLARRRRRWLRRRFARSLIAAAALAGIATAGGCDANPFCFNCTDGAPAAAGGADMTRPRYDFSFVPPDLLIASDGPCAPTNGGVEVCDRLDNDCNGQIDDVAAERLARDPNNCGACGRVCDESATHRYGECVGGAVGDGGAGMPRCAPAGCQPGWVDHDGDAANGCEYACSPSNGGVEICDGKDNDCNGAIDDGFGYPDYALDPSNCGACGGVCVLPGAVARCAADPKTGRGLCAVDHCINDGKDTYRHPGFMPGQLNTTGCEYHCPRPSVTVTGGGQDCDNSPCAFPGESCNGVDDDCDFAIDDDPFDANLPCGEPCPGGDVRRCVGGCRAGLHVCVAGVLTCAGARGPAPELCDGIDNDCNGVADDGPLDGWLGATCCPTGDLADCVNLRSGNTVGTRCMAGRLACAGGLRVCAGGVAQAPETCNAVDDNCNGVVDDIPGIGGACGGNGTNTTGRCTAAYACVGGQPGLGPSGLTCAQKVGPGAETCNGVDDDCDGVADDAAGDVGQPCASGCPGGLIANCVGACRAGVTACVNGGPACAGSSGPSPELCNGADDDCNGRVDDLAAIGQPCSGGGTNTSGACSARYVCTGRAGPGVQGLTCQQFQGPRPETCNGIDDDCNGVVDDNPGDVGQGCGDPCPGGQLANCRGECKAGLVVCSGGVRLCSGGRGAGPELCDGKDNDCNGTIDDGFGYPAYAGDPNHCGACNQRCSLANAVNGCHADLALDGSGRGVCYVVACNATQQRGYAYVADSCGGNTPPRDGALGVGCNYTCPVWPTSVEVCDGKDNNCNGVVDELRQGCAPDGLVAPPSFCATLGVCNGQNIPLVCQGAGGWRCNYSGVPAIELDGNGNLAPTEKRCDGRDGNCNGVVDLDGFPTLGGGCSDGVGACQTIGTIVCVNGNSAGCSARANPNAAGHEACNGKDDNCNGQIDERTDFVDGQGRSWRGWRDPMVAVPRAGGGSVWVYAQEASRPDATALSAGGSSARACATAGVRPWASVTAIQAEAACAAVKDSQGRSLRLCTEAEWMRACEGPVPAPTPRWSMSRDAASYAAQVCNDVNQALQPAVWPTGSNGAQSVQRNQFCYTDWQNGNRVYDMSGNLFEWTSTTVIAGGATYNRLRGGAFTSPQGGATCEFDFDIARPGFANTDVGFRCCGDAAP